MATADATKQPADRERARAEWVGRVDSLVAQIQGWAPELGLESRKIEKRAKDADFGSYPISGLLLQKGFVKFLLDPVAPSAPGADGGVVDLYLMPGLDDVASLYFYGGAWHLHYVFSGRTAVARPREAEAEPLTREALQEVVEEMTRNAG